MQVNAMQSSASSLLSSASSRANTTADFQAALDDAQQRLVVSGGDAAKVSATRKTAGEELVEYQNKSVGQHLREAILEEMGLTEGDLDAMPPEQRAAVEETIAEKIKERLLAQGEGAPGSTTPAASLLSLLTHGQAVIEQLSASSATSLA
ncbi:MAG: hypothetical protein H6R17_3060 [Proteobacteria bacterium]|nr:hypothetical protein [Pseudomonadota bacterium]